MPNKIIKSGNKRFQVYIFGAIVAVAIALATLVTAGVISQDDIEVWMLLVVGMVGAIVQFVTNLLAALNTDRDKTGVAGSEEPPVYVEPGAHAAE